MKTIPRIEGWRRGRVGGGGGGVVVCGDIGEQPMGFSHLCNLRGLRSIRKGGLLSTSDMGMCCHCEGYDFQAV